MKRIFILILLSGFLLGAIAATFQTENASPTHAKSTMYGQKGALVAAYQRTLNELGATLKVDSIWGNETEKAYTKFQDKISPYFGKRGTAIKRIQYNINDTYDAGIPEDGIWWDITERAYRVYENLPIIDAETKPGYVPVPKHRGPIDMDSIKASGK